MILIWHWLQELEILAALSNVVFGLVKDDKGFTIIIVAHLDLIWVHADNARW